MSSVGFRSTRAREVRGAACGELLRVREHFVDAGGLRLIWQLYHTHTHT